MRQLWERQRSASEITRELPFSDVEERLVWLALADLQKAQLLQDRISIPFNADGRTNRRDLLKRIGLGTAVAVPVVAGLALPAAAQGAGATMTSASKDVMIASPRRQYGGESMSALSRRQGLRW